MQQVLASDVTFPAFVVLVCLMLFILVLAVSKGPSNANDLKDGSEAAPKRATAAPQAAEAGSSRHVQNERQPRFTSATACENASVQRCF